MIEHLVLSQQALTRATLASDTTRELQKTSTPAPAERAKALKKVLLQARIFQPGRIDRPAFTCNQGHLREHCRRTPAQPVLCKGRRTKVHVERVATYSCHQVAQRGEPEDPSKPEHSRERMLSWRVRGVGATVARHGAWPEMARV